MLWWGTLGFQRLEPLLHRLQIRRSHTQRMPAAETAELSYLPEGWLLDR
jgi:hypothetical protein